MPLDAVEVTMGQLPVFVGGFAMTCLDSDLLCPAEYVNVLNFYFYLYNWPYLRQNSLKEEKDYQITR